MLRPQPRMTGALSASAAAHAGAAALVLFLAAGQAILDDAPPRGSDPPAIVWLPRTGPEGGRTPAGRGDRPAPRLARTGVGRVSVPASAPAPVEAAPPAPERPRLEAVAIAAEPSASALDDLLGALTSVSITASTGLGTGDRPGGDGTGPGGAGLGDGPRPGAGIGSDGAGSGLIPPRLLAQVRPSYTADAMRARIQGIVALEAVVLPDGTVGDVRVIRSLDATHGLDQEAIKAVRQWRFAAGTRLGRPVPFLISAELTFTLR